MWRPSETSLLVDLRALEGRRLYASLTTREPWVAVTGRWPETPSAPDRETLLLRRALEGARVAGVAVEDARRLVIALAPRHGHQPVLALQLAGRYANAAVLDRGEGGETELVRLILRRPATDPGSPPLPAGHPVEAGPADEAWLAAEAERHWSAEDARHLEERRGALRREAKTALKRKTRRRDALKADLARAKQADALRHRGELLKAELHRVRRGMREIAVTDYALEPPAAEVIELDPTLGPAENLKKIFNRYRKLVRGTETITEQLARAEDEVGDLGSILEALAGAADQAELDAGEARLRAAGVRSPALAGPSSHRTEAAARKPYRRFVACDGAEILVGRSARDNDDLTFHVARGSDLFLHARDAAGSHVILRSRGRSPPSSEAVLDAATLAAWTSKLRDELTVDVLVTERKHVKKPRGAPPGRVQTAAARTIAVRLDKARVDRLYGTLDPHERKA